MNGKSEIVDLMGLCEMVVRNENWMVTEGQPDELIYRMAGQDDQLI